MRSATALPRRPGRRAAVVVGLALLVVLGALAWAVLRSPLLAVDRVVVLGAGRVPVAQVLGLVDVPPGVPLARVDTGEVRRRVAALAPVRSVQVERAWPGTLRVRLAERRAAVGVVDADGVTLLDGDAVAFAREPRLPRGTVRLQVDRPGPDDPATRAALAVLAGLPDGLRGRTAAVRAPAPDAVSLELQDGREVVWGDPARGADKAAAAEALLRLPGRSYDVTSPDVVVRR